MERSEEEDGPGSEAADAVLSPSARALARTRSALDARRERIAIRLRHPAFRDSDAERLLREASDIAAAAELAMEEGRRDPPKAAPTPAPPPVPAALPAPRSASVAAGLLAPVVPPVPEAEPAAVVLSSRWEARAPPRLARRLADRVASGVTGAAVLRFGLLGVLATLAGGAVYGALQAVRPDEDAPLVTVRPPQVVELKPIRVRTVRIPVRPEPAEAAADAGREAADLRGAIPGFVQVVPGTPAAACATLVAAGWSTAGWSDSPVAAKGECLAERRYGPKGETNSFVVLRGGHSLAELRIKLNLGDAQWRGEAGRDAGRLVAQLFETWRWDGGPALAERIAALEPFEQTANGTSVRLTREHGEPERLNVLLRFPRPPADPQAAAEARAASLAALSAVAATHLGGVEILAAPVAAEPAER